jgi:hypothetical protein
MQEGGGNLYKKASDGSGGEELVLRSTPFKFPDDWSLDGRFIIYTLVDPKTNRDLWVLPTFGDRRPYPLLNTEFQEISGQFSADGHWVAYISNESGVQEVYVRSFPNTGVVKRQISNQGSGWPRWRRNGKELFYISPEGRLMVVDVTLSANMFDVGMPRPLFQTRAAAPHMGFPYAVSAHGQRFLVDTALEEIPSQPITVVVNWINGIKLKN